MGSGLLLPVVDELERLVDGRGRPQGARQLGILSVAGLPQLQVPSCMSAEHQSPAEGPVDPGVLLVHGLAGRVAPGMLARSTSSDG